MKTKKAISEIVTMTLLLFVILLSFFSLQNWYNNYYKNNIENLPDQQFKSLEILAINSSNILIKNPNSEQLRIKSIGFLDSTCEVNEISPSNSIESFYLDNCSNLISPGRYEVIIRTQYNVFSDSIILSQVSGGASFLDCSIIPYGDWILVPGNPALGTNDFCVMKYEAKATTSSEVNLFNLTNMYCGDGTDEGSNNCLTDGSINVTSKNSSKPLTQVSQTEAKQLCSNLGSGYSLITNSQWITIARNVENVSSNWADGTIGSTVASGGGLKRGNIGIDDSASYNAVSDPADRSLDANPLSMFTLSNEEEIWDISGNVWEWTNDTFNTNTESSLGQVSNNWHEWTTISGHDYLESSNTSLDTNYGIGRVYTDIDDAYPSGIIHGLLHGGNWGDGINAGAFSLNLYYSPSSSAFDIGFRCSFTP
ncbi:MAG: SUMF1/EgtB/PvdO family nonheme iron enzyme [Nanoarchaeota archaeon]|nr:SUMF1/EgtB/PvdO family nonheme iron enzyme [Nanoarchaeota archaeon]